MDKHRDLQTISAEMGLVGKNQVGCLNFYRILFHNIYFVHTKENW